MGWQWKCVVDNLKGVVPFGSYIRRRKYDFIEYRSLHGRADWALEEGLQQLEWLLAARSLAGAVVLEIGTGWEPIIPLLYSIAGASRVYLTDLNRLCSPGSVQGAIDAVVRNKAKVLGRLGAGEDRFRRAVEWKPAQTGVDAGLERIGLLYLAPCDCQQLDLPSASIDVISSRAVLEHIPPPVIEGIHNESYRLLKSDGHCCHFVDPSDHWEHNDKSISKINFIGFSDFTNSLTNFNGMNYQNRLRHSDYVKAFEAAGFRLVREERDIDAASVEALRAGRLKPAPRFHGYTHEDLATVNSFLLATK
jgi:SAM-dependent methyltransferase